MKRGVPVFIALLILIVACTPPQPVTPVKPGSALQIRTTVLPQWEAPGSATYKLDVVGGTPPYSFSGALPSGFNIGPDGTIGGLARLSEGTSHSESPPFTITVTDSAGATAQVSLTISIVAKNTLQIINTPVNCVMNQECDEQIASASGGNPPYSFQSDSFMNGAPPFGTIVDINGHLTGKPSRAGTSSVGVCVKDKLSYQQCGQSVVTIEEGLQLQGTWEGTYGETETSSWCSTRNDGQITLSVTEKDGAFSGSITDTGVSTAYEQTDSCTGGSYQMSGTVSGTIVEDVLSGTMRFSGDVSYVLPFPATITTDRMRGSYSGTGSFDGGASQISSGSFHLTKKT